MTPYALGALLTPPEVKAKAWPITLAVAAAPTVPLGLFHSPKCDAGVTLDQNPFGACVSYGEAYAQAGQELEDEHRQLNPKVLDPLRAYAEVKGLPWPLTDPAQDPSPGLWPAQLFDYLRRKGWPTKDGSPRRPIAAYYTLGTPSSSPDFLATYYATVMALGAVGVSLLWPDNWWGTDETGHMLPPSSRIVGGHHFEACGGYVYPDTWDLIGHMAWGDDFGMDPDLPSHFRVRAPYLDRLGEEAWKFVDVIGDAPAPPAEVGMLPTYGRPDPVYVDLAIGTQLYREDGKTPLVQVSSGGSHRYSPGYAYPTQRAVWISTGGVPQNAVVNIADCRNVQPYASPHKVQARVSLSVEVDDQPGAQPVEASTPPVMV